MAKKKDLKFEGEYVDYQTKHQSHAIAVIVLLVALLVVFLFVAGLRQPTRVPTTPGTQPISRSYSQVIYQGVIENKITFEDAGVSLTFELAEGYHVFNTNSLPHKPAAIEAIKTGQRIDVVVRDNLVIAVFY